MKQYTTPEQTSKLMELGFEKPKNTQYVQRVKARNLHSPFIEFGEPAFEGSYTIGELIEMLPQEINSEALPNRFRVYPDHYKKWKVDYSNIWGELYSTYRTELIDALYDMCVKLKDEGVV